MSNQNEERPKVTLGGEEYEIPPLSAGNGLRIGFILMPYLVELAPAIRSATSVPSEERESGWEIAATFDATSRLQGLLKSDVLLELGHLLTSIDVDILEKAPLSDFVAAIATAVMSIDLRSALESVGKVVGAMTRAGLGEEVAASTE